MPPVPSESVELSLRFGRFEIQPAERLLRVDGEPVALGGRAFDVLLVLAERHARLVSKQELLDLVWPGLVVEEHNIATQIANLRKLLGAGVIATVPGRGYRLTAPPEAAPATQASVVAATQPMNNLPEQRTRFIGREAALAGLARLLPPARLLTLTGIGGCGKTRLALQFAQQRLAAFPDGVWFVDLAPLKDAGRVAATCAAALGLRAEGGTPLMTRLCGHLATRRTLLVLDNCEHVLRGAAALVDGLLAGTADTRILATSREGLGVGGEQLYPVRSLSLPATDDLQAVRGAESARVFIDRARLGSPEFEVDAGNAAPLADICRRLDGIALAIELAAARVAMLSVAEIAQRLDDRFRLLTGGSRTLPRHQTLHGATQWSYELLSAQEQRMLRELSVFAGGCTLQAAAHVAQEADEYDTLARLTALHDKSLLVVDRESEGGRPRYRMLETVRQYALERLNESGEAEAVRGRHVAYYVAWAEEAEPHLRGPDQAARIVRLRQENENLVAALGWCCEGAVDSQSGLRLAAATNYYWVWNNVELGHRLACAVLAHDVAAVDTLARVGTLQGIAKMSLFRGRCSESLAYAQQALAVARRVGSARWLAQALGSVGSALNTLGQADEALRCHEEAVELMRPLDEPWLMSSLLNNLAEAKRSVGDLDAAERCYREALEIAQLHSGARLSIVCFLNNLLRVQVARGQPRQALRFAIECLPLVGDEKIGVDLLEATVGLAAGLGEHARAIRFWAAVCRTMREWGYEHQPVDVAHTARSIASCRHALGDAAFDAAEAAGRELEFAAAMLELKQWLERAG